MTVQNFGKKIMAGGMATLFAASCFGAPMSAFALDGNDPNNFDPQTKKPIKAISTTGYVNGAATRAAMPSIEILGLASVEESGQFIDTRDYYFVDATTGAWTYPKYWLDASAYNSQASPFLANLATAQKNVDGYQTAVLDTSRSGGGQGPNASLGTSGKDAEVWDRNPAVVVGTGGGSDWYTTDGRDALGVNYGFSNYEGLCDTMDNIARAAEQKASDDSELRFGSARAITTNYRQYIYGTMGLIQQAIDSGNEVQKTVALVENAVWDEDEECWMFDLLTTAESGAGDGTASQNRYLETVLNTDVQGISLAKNYADTAADSSSVPASQLLSSVDLVMVGGQQSSGNYAIIMRGLEASNLLPKTYWVQNNGSAGAQYGVVMNSVENAQNVGRILGMLYPLEVNQQSWLAYYYQNFYHINADDKTNNYTELTEVMQKALYGVRNATMIANNADADVNWNNITTAYGNGQNNTVVQRLIESGYTYYMKLQG